MDQLKRRLGFTIISLNEDILKLQKNYKLLRDSEDGWRTETLKKSTVEIEDRVQTRKQSLESTLEYLTENPNTIDEQKQNKYFRYVKTTIESADKCLSMKVDMDEETEKEIDRTATEINDAIEQDSEDNKSLEDILNQLDEPPEETEEEMYYDVDQNLSEDEMEENEFRSLSPHEQNRYNKRCMTLKNLLIKL